MKLTAFLLTACFLQVSARVASQNVTFSGKNVSLETVFSAVERQTGYLFLYRENVLAEAKPVTISASNEPLLQFLDDVFKGQPLTYLIGSKTINISPLSGSSNDIPESGSTPLVSIPAHGRLLDESGRPVAGANIMIKGTRTGVASDENGFFSITVNVGDVVVISFVGYETKEVRISARSLKPGETLELGPIALTPSIREEKGVTINGGYYTTTDLKKTGNITKVGAREIEHQPVTSPLMALQGRVPGMDITPSNGIPGSFTKVVIRGQNSISNVNATPLYVVDGIPINSSSISSDNVAVMAETSGYDPLSGLNPANIESIEILKDADATSIYGSRGANGVILITTKRGNLSGKTNVDLSFTSGQGRIPKFLKLLTTPQYVAIRKEALQNAGRPIDARDLVVWDTTRYTDWQKELLGGAAVITDLQANVSGGNASTNFRLGGSYHKEGTIYPGDFGYRRLSGNFSLNHASPDQKFRASLSLNYDVEPNNVLTTTLVSSATTLAPDAPALYDSAGNLNWEHSTFGNPMARLKKGDTRHSNTLMVNSALSYGLIPGLALKVNMGYNTLDANSVIRVNTFATMDPATITSDTRAASEFETDKRSGWILEPQVTYNKQSGEHELNILAGASLQENNTAHQLVYADGYTSDVLLESLRGATQTTYYVDDNSRYRYMSVLGRIGYGYKQKYLLSLTGRRDGSSRFGPNHRWGNFGSVGAAWIFSEENFMKNLSFLSLGKLRGSYGVTGSDQVGDYQYLSTYQFTQYQYQGAISLYPAKLTNSSYAWEQTIKLEMALELGFLDNRIRLESVFYRNRCSNQLLNYQLPDITGFTGVTQNLNATVQNTGLEFVLQTVNADRPNFQWRSAFNITIPHNKLVSYTGLAQSPYANTYVVGQPLSIAKLYNYLGVNPITGLYEVKDVDGDGVFDLKDRTFIQNTGRRYYGGLNNTFRYKSVELSFFLYFSQQTSSNVVYFTPGSTPDNIPQEVVGNYWRHVGDKAKYQKATTDYSLLAGNSYTNSSNASYVSSSFVRLKTLLLSYTLPPALLKKVGLKAGKLFAEGQNLLTFSSFPALDPEAKTSSLPPIRMITAGVEIKL